MNAKPMREQSYLILLALASGPLYGYGIIAAVRELSDQRIKLGPGTLYTALDRLSGEGLITLDHEEVVDGRFRRYYRLTEPGDNAVSAETERLTALASRARARLSGRPLPGLS